MINSLLFMNKEEILTYLSEQSNMDVLKIMSFHDFYPSLESDRHKSCHDFADFLIKKETERKPQKITREMAHEMCLSRDCNCVAGKDRDSNYHETIDKIFDQFECVVIS